jgi:hypothetical protein
MRNLKPLKSFVKNGRRFFFGLRLMAIHVMILHLLTFTCLISRSSSPRTRPSFSNLIPISMILQDTASQLFSHHHPNHAPSQSCARAMSYLSRPFRDSDASFHLPRFRQCVVPPGTVRLRFNN